MLLHPLLFSRTFFYTFIIGSFTWFCLYGFYSSKVKSAKSSLDANNKTEACGRFPREEDITVDNEIWQVLETSKGFVKLLNAYLDERQNKSVVRINVNSMKLNESDVFYCQFWFNDSSKPTVVETSEVLLMWSEF
jgi:hypothetical protein